MLCNSQRVWLLLNHWPVRYKSAKSKTLFTLSTVRLSTSSIYSGDILVLHRCNQVWKEGPKDVLSYLLKSFSQFSQCVRRVRALPKKTPNLIPTMFFIVTIKSKHWHIPFRIQVSSCDSSFIAFGSNVKHSIGMPFVSRNWHHFGCSYELLDL